MNATDPERASDDVLSGLSDTDAGSGAASSADPVARRRAARPKLLATTNRDIAKLAKVSVVTVSRYFNSPSQVSETLREREHVLVAERRFQLGERAQRQAQPERLAVEHGVDLAAMRIGHRVPLGA